VTYTEPPVAREHATDNCGRCRKVTARMRHAAGEATASADQGGESAWTRRRLSNSASRSDRRSGVERRPSQAPEDSR
jgi:hypothetical protein